MIDNYKEHIEHMLWVFKQVTGQHFDDLKGVQVYIESLQRENGMLHIDLMVAKDKIKEVERSKS